MVSVYNATDTAFALPEHDGEYKIKGLKEGTYAIHFDATFPYLDSTITGIRVYKGKETKVANMTLHK